MPELYIGLMSGTSMDGIDAALVEFDNTSITLVTSHSHPLPAQLKEKLKLLSLNADQASIDMLGETDTELGDLFADSVNELLKISKLSPEQVVAIGSHGQTVRHRPDLNHRFTMQIADANLISYKTGITTVSDFRRKDMAAGGEGAPLAPAFHQQVFHSETENRAVLNIGGIANLTALPADPAIPCSGFDTGPGNALMDAWIHTHKSLDYDRHGEWAASTSADSGLLKQLMQDPYLSLTPPKSTGKEHYNIEWLIEQLKHYSHLSAESVQASLCKFTSLSIAEALQRHMPETQTLIVCGGGVHNSHLMSQLKSLLPSVNIQTSDHYGIHPDWVEAIAFAWLARQTLNHKPGNLPAVTGAKNAVILGAIHFPN